MCDFTISGVPPAAVCDNKTKNSATFQAGNIPSGCTVYVAGSNLTFETDGVKVTPDYPDSYQDFTGLPTLKAFYWVNSSGGTITPQFTIKFNAGAVTVYHQVTRPVSCQ